MISIGKVNSYGWSGDYGFIRDKNGQDIFFHINNVVKPVEKGQIVLYEIAKDKRHPGKLAALYVQPFMPATFVKKMQVATDFIPNLETFAAWLIKNRESIILKELVQELSLDDMLKCDCLIGKFLTQKQVQMVFEKNISFESGVKILSALLRDGSIDMKNFVVEFIDEKLSNEYKAVIELQELYPVWYKLDKCFKNYSDKCDNKGLLNELSKAGTQDKLAFLLRHQERAEETWFVDTLNGMNEPFGGFSYSKELSENFSLDYLAANIDYMDYKILREQYSADELFAACFVRHPQGKLKGVLAGNVLSDVDLDKSYAAIVNDRKNFSERWYHSAFQKVLARVAPDGQAKFIRDFSYSMLHKQGFFKFVGHERMYQLLVENLAPEQWLTNMRDDEKVLLIYFLAKHGDEYAGFFTKNKEYLMQGRNLSFIAAYIYDHRGHFSNAKLHELLCRYIQPSAEILKEKLIDMRPLFPACKYDFRIDKFSKFDKKLLHCESKPWAHTNEDNKTATRGWCPRLYCPIGYDECATNVYIYDTNKNIQDWSICELLAACHIDYDPRDLQTLIGAANRMNEIRERLKCSQCGQFMEFTLNYSKGKAAHLTTVASCLQGAGHDQRVYLNTCHGCGGVIDSRVDRIVVDNMNVCHICGAASMKEDYVPGSVCPRCGSLNTYRENRKVQCHDCNHIVRLTCDGVGKWEQNEHFTNSPYKPQKKKDLKKGFFNEFQDGF